MRRYRLPILSGVLLALAFYPFYFWPLALVALAPLFYFAVAPGHSGRETFWGGFWAGGIAVAPTLYFTLAQLVMQPGAPLLTYAVRASSIFFFFFIGALFGAMTLVCRRLRGRGALPDSLLMASLYTLVELVLFNVFGGYYYASLAHALVPFPPALLLAALGGVPLLIFCASWINATIAQRSWRLGALVFIFLFLVVGGEWWVERSVSGAPVMPVAVIQRAPSALAGLAEPAPAPYADPALQALLSNAANGGATALVVYPYSPVEAVYKGSKPSIVGISNVVADEAIGAWLNSFTPASTTVMLWDTLVQGGGLYDEFNFWKGGVEQSYQKHFLYPLADYTPEWLRALGLAHAPFTLLPGSADRVEVGGAAVAGLSCSELQQEAYARAQAQNSGLLLSVGTDAFFPGDLAGNWSVAAARLRAAENGVPMVRGTIFGPSAIINADGSTQVELAFGQTGILRGNVLLQKIPTLYARAGSWPLYGLIALIFLYFLIVRVDDDINARRG